jgi:hypothetical protein
MEGRAFLLFSIAVMSFIIIIFTRFLIIDWSLEKLIYLAFMILIILPLMCFVLYHLWYRCFGKIIISDNCIEWRCIFMRSHRLSFDKCKYAGIQIFWKDNVVKYDIYNTGFAFIYVSTKPYPSEYEGRIDKLRCTDEFIKFPRNERIC